MATTSGRRIGFVGAGRMATALAEGFLRARIATAAELYASEPVPETAERFGRATGARLLPSNADVVSASDLLILAVKPQQMGGVLAELRPLVGADHLVVSVAAGVSLAALASGLGSAPRLIRVMPNTPALVGCGASAFSLGQRATAADAQRVQALLSAVGIVYQVDEKLLDAVTGLSGSGPAYVYLMIEALADGGVWMGLPREVALGLAAQTVQGAAAMVLAGNEHPAALRDQVASPGGTTVAGLAILEQAAFRGAVAGAVRAATLRSQELGAAAVGKPA